MNEPPSDLGVWSEFLPQEEVRGQLAALAERNADLYLAVRPEEVNEGLWSLCADARAVGVAVRPWLQLPDQGTWLNEQNVAEFADFVGFVLDRAAENHAPIEWLIVDLEPAWAYAEALHAAAESRDTAGLLSLLSAHRDPRGFAAASTRLQELIDKIHARGVKVMAVALPWILDDLLDGDADFQDIFDTPLAGAAWDQVCVMVYRPAFSDFFGVSLSPGYVAAYARVAKRMFGANAQVAIGSIGAAGLFIVPGYTDPRGISLDVAAARSAGLNSVSLFSLDGMVTEGGPARWLAAASQQTPQLPEIDPVTAVLRTVLQWLDRMAGEPPPESGRPASRLPSPSTFSRAAGLHEDESEWASPQQAKRATPCASKWTAFSEGTTGYGCCFSPSARNSSTRSNRVAQSRS